MIYKKLYDWQKSIVDTFKTRDKFGLFLDMGLGKTPISLALAEANQCSKILVVTLNSKALEDETVSGSWLQWASELRGDYVLHSKNSTATFDVATNDVFVVNFEGLFKRASGGRKGELKERIAEFLVSCKDRNIAIIIDESHKLKNLSSKQTIAVAQIMKISESICKSTKFYLLTGTPFTSGYIDLHSQLFLLGYGMSKTKFIDKFCERGNVLGLLGWQQPIVAYKNVDKLFDLVHQYAITAKSEDIMHLPDKIFVEHKSPQSKVFKKFVNEKLTTETILNELAAESIKIPDFINLTVRGSTKQSNPFYRNIAFPKDDWFAETSGTFWLRARQLSIGFQGNVNESKWFDRRRLRQLRSFLESNEDNYVLFYNYTPELLELYPICESLNYNIDVYCGEIKSLQHYENFEKLSASDKLTHKKNIILANFVSGSTGMNWQCYDKCILFSLPIYRDYEQGIKRVHRIGQKNTVVYHVFSQDNFLDNGMRKSLQDNIDYSKDMFESDLSRVQDLITFD